MKKTPILTDNVAMTNTALSGSAGPGQPAASPIVGTTRTTTPATTPAKTPAKSNTGSTKTDKNKNTVTATDVATYSISGSANGSTSNNTAAASAYLESLKKGQPSAFQSRWASQINDLMTQINGRGNFDYNADNDPLYQQYKDLYTANGQRAMKDTVAQSAALTGGYGNSWAQTAGQQMYDQYMQQLTDKSLDLRNQAYQQWQDEGNALYNRLGMYNTADDTDYTRWYNDAQLANTDRSYYANYVNAMLAAGKMPSDDMLALAGLSKKDAKKLLVKIEKASGGGGGNGSKKKVESPSFLDVNVADFPNRNPQAYQDALAEYIQNNVETPPQPAQLSYTDIQDIRRQMTDPMYALMR